MEVGERIKMYRERANMTQAELAARIGAIPQSIYKYEQGVITNIPLTKIKRIADVFMISPGVLAGWEESGCEPSDSFVELYTKISKMSPETSEPFVKACLAISRNFIGADFSGSKAKLYELIRDLPEDKAEMLYRIALAALER